MVLRKWEIKVFGEADYEITLVPRSWFMFSLKKLHQSKTDKTVQNKLQELMIGVASQVSFPELLQGKPTTTNLLYQKIKGKILQFLKS